MSEGTANTWALSALNNRLLTILLAIALAVVVLVVLAVILLTVGISKSRSTPPYRSLGALTMSTATAGNDSRSFRSNLRVALPAQPIAAARELVHTVGGTQLPCYPQNVNQWYLARRGCPVTPRFRRYLLAHMRDIDPVCQCQNYPIRSSFRLLFQRAGLATVAATLTFTYSTVYIVFVEVKRGAGWAVTANYVTHT